tara:strand:+ start:1022 stop:1402 length:381 start_codon:yes stop_codon:yes gene_type:complete
MANYRDLNTDFKTISGTQKLKVVKDNEAIKSSLNNIIRTNSFDRPFQPNIGSNLRSLLFEPMTSVTRNRIISNIEATIQALEPRAQDYEVNVEELPEQNEYRIEIKFYVQDQLEPIEFETFLSRVR